MLYSYRNAEFLTKNLSVLLDFADFWTLDFVLEQSHFAQKLYRRELHSVCVEDQEVWELTVKEKLKVLEAARYKYRAEKPYRELIKEPVAPLDLDKMLEKINADKFRERVGPDPYDREVKIMAEVRANYHHAASRFIEIIRMGVDAEVVELSQADVHDMFRNLLAAVNSKPNYAAELLEQDSERHREREMLVEKNEKLKNIWEELQSLSRHQPGWDTNEHDESSDGDNMDLDDEAVC
jgi:hypothetical protein